MVQLKGTSLTTKLALTLTSHRILQKIKHYVSMFFRIHLKSYFINNLLNGFCNTKIDNLQDSNYRLNVTPSKNLKFNNFRKKRLLLDKSDMCWLFHSLIIQKLKTVGCHHK